MTTPPPFFFASCVCTFRKGNFLFSPTPFFLELPHIAPFRKKRNGKKVFKKKRKKVRHAVRDPFHRMRNQRSRGDIDHSVLWCGVFEPVPVPSLENTDPTPIFIAHEVVVCFLFLLMRVFSNLSSSFSFLRSVPFRRAWFAGVR